MGGDMRVPIQAVRSSAHRIPTDRSERDGTFAWDSTTLVVVQVHAAGQYGMGYTYADAPAASLPTGVLVQAVAGLDLMDIGACAAAMQLAVRNLGRSGVAACAMSVD